jgi:hypothetical protein
MTPPTTAAQVQALERLRHFLSNKGGCRVLSKGDQCQCPLCDLDTLSAALQSPGTPAEPSGWLIERHIAGVLHYWTGDRDRWSSDVNDARRFARQEDAACMLTWHCGDIGRAVEHLWTKPAAAPNSQEAITDWRCGGCGYRWAERHGRGVTLCGDCWRKVQRVLHAPCVAGDTACPCVDGDSCHYLPTADTRAMRVAAPPAPEARLVELVREWQEARKPVGLAAPGVGVAETYQAAMKRMAAADEALAAFNLDSPEDDDETETCETCQQPITGQAVRSWDDVSLCEDCAEPDRNTAEALNASLAATAEIRKRERSAKGGGDFHMGGDTPRRAASLREELTEIIRWRFRTADGAAMNGPLILERAMEIADEIAPFIEEATGER